MPHWGISTILSLKIWSGRLRGFRGSFIWGMSIKDIDSKCKGGCFVRTIKSFDELNIPADYKEYLSQYLYNLSDIPFISRVILFGSCAREDVREYSDIDIFITADKRVTDEDEYVIACQCRPPYSMKSIPLDIIVQDEDSFSKNEATFGMLQKQVAREGVDLSELLR